MAATKIREASSDEDYAEFGRLISQYLDWARERYHDDVWFIGEVFGHQSLDQEVQNLAAVYGAPNGLTLLARRDGQICGAGAYRRLSPSSCEMKRLFVPKQFHGLGVGSALCSALLDAARVAGYSHMKLDTARRLEEAIALYTRYGFTNCAPYHAYPDNLMPYLIFMERDLSAH